MSIRARKVLFLLGVLGLAAVESACVNHPTESSDESSYCRENPSNCTVARAPR
jgi:hypothetical protein